MTDYRENCSIDFTRPFQVINLCYHIVFNKIISDLISGSLLIITHYLVTDIRLQLNDQLRCLDVRMEAQVALLTELQDFFRRRGELELDYSKNLDKLAKSLQLRHKEQKQK